MSVANVIFEPHRLRLVGDTVAYRGKEPVQLNRKVHIVKHAHVAFTVRGLSKIGWVMERCTKDWRDFESSISQAAEILSLLPENYFQKDHPTSETTILGWRDGQAQVTRLGAERIAGRVRILRVDLVPGVYLAPSLGAHQIPASLSDEQILKVALLQQSIAIKHGLNICVGGDVEVTTVTADTIETRKIGEYPDKRMTEALIARAALRDDMEQAA